jgi:hypothetical protein
MQVGKISAYDLQKNFDGFYYEIQNRRWDYVTRVLHNEEQIIRCQLRDATNTPPGIVKYWNMDGTSAAQFTVGAGGSAYTQILDMGWLNNESKFCYVITASGMGVTTSGYRIVTAASDASAPQVLVKDIYTTNTRTFSQASVSGYVGITASDYDIFLKIGPELHQIDRYALIGGDKDWNTLVAAGSVKSSTDAFHYGPGTECQNMLWQGHDEITGSGCLLYTWYDWGISTLYLRSITTSGVSVPTYNPSRWTMLDLPLYSSIRTPIFINRLDYNALHRMSVISTAISGATAVYSGTTAYLHVFNIDSDLAAFLNVNSSDIVMPAGIGATADIFATVVNCWGTTLSGKLVQFWVSSGDGGVYPTYAYTDTQGKAQTEFTTGANVGISNIAVVVNEI